MHIEEMHLQNIVLGFISLEEAALTFTCSTNLFFKRKNMKKLGYMHAKKIGS